MANQRVNPLDDPSWDEKIARLPGASFFHSSAWARVLRDTYGFRPVYFVQQQAGEIQGVLPVMEVDSWATGRRGVSLPFTDTCEPLAANQATRASLIRSAMDYAQECRWKSCEFRGGRTCFGHEKPSTSFYGHSLDLRASDRLFAQLDSAARRAVRKAQKSAVTIEFTHKPESVLEFYELLCQTRRRLGIPPQPFRFFINIQRHLLAPRRGCVVLARHEGSAIAGAVFFHSGRTALYKFGASDNRFQHLRGNNLVMWSAIEWHAKMGFEAFDFGRTSIANEGLRTYKLSWGATEHRIDYTKFDFRRGAFVVQRDNASGWKTKVFSVLPLPISRAVGCLLYKHVA